MLRRIAHEWLPQLGIVIGTLILACALRESAMTDAQLVPPGPGFDIALGSGLQGNGSNGNPLDIKHGTEAGQLAAWNGTQYVIDQYTGDPKLRYWFINEFEQFLTNCTTIYPGFIGSCTGAACGCSSTAISGHPGILNLHPGTTATGFARYLSNGTNYSFGGGNGEVCQQTLLQIKSVSTAVIEYIIRTGFMDSTNAANSTDAVQAVYDRPNTGNFWALETRSAGVGTLKPCDGSGGTVSVPIVVDSWYGLRTCVSSDGTSATLTVNGTLCATNTTNIPTSTNSTGLGSLVSNNSGSVPIDVNVFFDYQSATAPFGAARQ